MNKERLKTNYNVDADKVDWQESENRGYKTEDISGRPHQRTKEDFI